jgi:hypothetical protein
VQPSKDRLLVSATVRGLARCAALAALLPALLGGCGPRPRAPALQDEPVYQNKQEGFHFLPPEGWIIHARAEVPPGKLSEERLLVEYKRVTSAKPASLEVSMADIPAGTDVAACLEGRASPDDSWQPQGSAENIEVGGQPAARRAFLGQFGQDRVMREIMAVRRGGRVYFFTGLFPADDSKAREQVRKAVASVAW